MLLTRWTVARFFGVGNVLILSDILLETFAKHPLLPNSSVRLKF